MKKLQTDLFVPDNFSESHHYYSDEDGEHEYTGITTIIGTLAKPALIQWAANMAVEWIRGNATINKFNDEILDYEVTDELLEEARVAHRKKKEAAGEHGTDVHALVEEYIGNSIRGFEGKPTPLGLNIQQFADWAMENVDHFLYAERPVHSKVLFLAGTIDSAAVMKDGTRRVIDVKTGSGIYYEAILQTEFYQLLAEEEGDERYDGAVIVNMKKNGEFQTQVRARSDIDQDAALGLFAAYRGSQSFISKK